MAFAQKIQEVFESSHHNEGKLTSMIEEQTAKVPSVVYFNLAVASIVGSLAIAVTTRKTGWANFVGHWASAFMLMGIYNKLVKQHEET